MLATAARIRGSLAGLAEALSASTTAATARSMPRHRSTALAPRVGRLDAALDHGVGEHDRGGGAVAGDLVGLHRDLARHLRAHVLEPVRQLDLGGDADPVAGDHRRADRPVDHRVQALGPERRLDGGGQTLEDAAGERAAGSEL